MLHCCALSRLADQVPRFRLSHLQDSPLLSPCARQRLTSVCTPCAARVIFRADLLLGGSNTERIRITCDENTLSQRLQTSRDVHFTELAGSESFRSRTRYKPIMHLPTLPEFWLTIDSSKGVHSPRAMQKAQIFRKMDGPATENFKNGEENDGSGSSNKSLVLSCYTPRSFETPPSSLEFWPYEHTKRLQCAERCNSPPNHGKPARRYFQCDGIVSQGPGYERGFEDIIGLEGCRRGYRTNKPEDIRRNILPRSNQTPETDLGFLPVKYPRRRQRRGA